MKKKNVFPLQLKISLKCKLATSKKAKSMKKTTTAVHLLRNGCLLDTNTSFVYYQHRLVCGIQIHKNNSECNNCSH